VGRYRHAQLSAVRVAGDINAWFIVDAGAITDIDYSAARSIRELLDDPALQKVTMIFARVSPYGRSDTDRHCITAAIGEARIFTTLHEANRSHKTDPRQNDR
jgi:sulfate permease, SulP family